MKICFFIALFLFFTLYLVHSQQNDFEVLATSYFNQGKTIQAAEFYNKAGYAYWNKNQKDKAADMFEKAFDLFSGQGNNFASQTVANNLGLIYMDQINYTKAYSAFNRALEYARKTKNTIETYNSLLNVGSVALELAQYKDAVVKSGEALNLAKELNNLRMIAKCYALMAESYEKMGNSSDAYKYFELYATVDKKLKDEEMSSLQQMSAEEIGKAEEKKRVAEIELKIKKGELKLTQDSLGVAERLAYEREMQVQLRSEQLRQKEMQLSYERKLRNTLQIGLGIILFFLIIMGLLLTQKLRDNKKLQLQKEEIAQQNKRLDIQNKKITDSIYYGMRIQQAMLPSGQVFSNRFESFILFRPKDIVSGDFYWFYEVQHEDTISRFIALADCTGHGVPGAFMSMIGNRLLNQAIVERKIYQPSEALAFINCNLQIELATESNELMDGMDIALCKLTMRNDKYEGLVFAGAKRPVMIKRSTDSALQIIEGTRKGIGGFAYNNTQTFNDHNIMITNGDLLILYSDGIIDQPDTSRNRFGTNRFKAIITENCNQSVSKIKTEIETAFDIFTLGEEQRDDITVLGLRLI